MVDQAFDWSSFQRLDNASVVDFLTSTAGALCECGLISRKETDNLRLVLSGINTLSASRERPLLLELDSQDAEFLAVLTARFGTTGLCLNLVRHTLRAKVADTHRALAEFGQQLVKKAELLFNRPFRVFYGGRCQRQTLYSTVIIDFSETLARAAGMLERALEDLALLNRSDMAAANERDGAVDQKIADALGFRGLVSHSMPMHAEMETKRTVALALALVAEAAAEFMEQLAQNTGAESGYAAASAGEWLKVESQRLLLLDFPQSESLMTWEVRRRNLSASISSINEALRHLTEASLGSLGGSDQVRQAGRGGEYSEAVRRRITFDLIAAGVAHHRAREATSALFRYLEEQSLKPHQVLVGELARIHPSLIPSSLETLVAIEAGSPTMEHSHAEKKSTMARARQLATTFAKALTPAASALLAALLLLPLGCGLKTKPTSDVVELRPDIPFRDEPPRDGIDLAPGARETPQGPGPRTHEQGSISNDRELRK